MPKIFSVRIEHLSELQDKVIRYIQENYSPRNKKYKTTWLQSSEAGQTFITCILEEEV